MQTKSINFSLVAIMLALAFGLILTFCFLRPAKAIEGVYIFHSPEAEETLEIKPGGEFIQKIKMGGDDYAAIGNWSLQGRALRLDGDFLMRFDTSSGKLIKPPKEVSAYYPIYWDSWHDRLSFSEDYDAEYFLKRAR